MSLLDQLNSLVEDPPPGYAFEISAAGISHAVRPSKRGQPPEVKFHPFDGDLLAIAPAKDNVLQPEAFSAHVAALIPQNGNKRKRSAVLILPDYCSRVAVIDFDSFPDNREEQLALIRFRLKKSVPFDVDTAAVNFQVQKGAHKKVAVIVASAAYEIVAKYEFPFRAAGFTPGFVTTSTLASLDLLPKEGLNVAAKLAGRVLTVAVCDGRHPKLVRCIELSGFSIDEIMSVLFPTLAYAEDELKTKPQHILACGFDILALSDACQRDLGVSVEPMRSPWGNATDSNAGLLGWLQAQEARL
jgi:type IV pilus assembly protein PilM